MNKIEPPYEFTEEDLELLKLSGDTRVFPDPSRISLIHYDKNNIEYYREKYHQALYRLQKARHSINDIVLNYHIRITLGRCEICNDEKLKPVLLWEADCGGDSGGYCQNHIMWIWSRMSEYKTPPGF